MFQNKFKRKIDQIDAMHFEYVRILVYSFSLSHRICREWIQHLNAFVTDLVTFPSKERFNNNNMVFLVMLQAKTAPKIIGMSQLF